MSKTINSCTNPLQTLTAEQLLNMEFAPIRPVISRILPTGTFIFAGASKIGKSWMVLWFANQIALGQPVWEFATTQSEVLYLSLEDTPRRLQQRLDEIADEVGNVHFATKSDFIGGGFEEQLVNFIEQYPKVKLIIIDTLQKVRKAGRDKFAYADDYEVIGKIKEIGDSHDVTILIIHHTRKEGDNDAINTISGTNGIVGSADGAFVLQKENRMQNRANLVVTGRDVQTITLSLVFQPDTCKWELLSHSDNEITTAEDPVLVAVHQLLSSGQSKWQSTASDLLVKLKEYNPVLDVRANTLTRKLNSNADMLLAKYNILYCNKRVGTEKHIVLKFEQTDMYDKTDILDTVGYPRDTDNTAHIVQSI